MPGMASKAGLEPFLTPERLAPYRGAVGGDLDAALPLYEWNTQIGAALLEVLGHLEIVMRNAMDRSLSVWFSTTPLTGEWYDDPLHLFDSYRTDDVQAAHGRLARAGKADTHGRVIAELPFGFWRFLLSGRYQTTLWAQALRHAFPGLQPQSRAVVYGIVDDLGTLRNRIAHHEPIHHLDLAKRHADLLQLAAYIDPGVGAWVDSVSRVATVLAARP